MQAELDAEYPNLNIKIVGINMIATEAGITDVSLISTLPMVQDDTTVNIWTSWNATWRDVQILNPQNEVVHVFNLTQHSLAPGNGFCTDNVSIDQATCEGDPTAPTGETWHLNYAYLKQLFIDTASQ